MYPFSNSINTSFNGSIEEIPDIRLDNFKSIKVPRAYFLSHCHTDHTVGMSEEDGKTLLSKLKNKDPPTYIYMSEPSAIIVENGGIWNVPFEIAKYIKTLELGNNLIHLPEDTSEDYEEKYIDVTVLPAGHCLGSVMFLFKTDKTIVYTGDIRISISDLSKFSKLHDKNNDVIPIDAVYVDATFYEDKYKEFPSRKESVECIIDHIKEWIEENRQHKVCLKCSANFGYEYIFNEIHDKLNLKTWVPNWKWKVYSQLPHIQSLTNDSDQDKIQICTSCCCCKDDDNYLIINMSARRWTNYKKERNFYERGRRTVRVCFSTHSSKSELDYFINYLKPKKAVGFVDGKNKQLVIRRNHDLRKGTSFVNPVKIERPPRIRVKINSDVIKNVFEF